MTGVGFALASRDPYPLSVINIFFLSMVHPFDMFEYGPIELDIIY